MGAGGVHYARKCSHCHRPGVWRHLKGHSDMFCSHCSLTRVQHMCTRIHTYRLKYGQYPTATQTHSSQSHSEHTEIPAGHPAAGTAHACQLVTDTQSSQELHWDPTQAEMSVGTQQSTPTQIHSAGSRSQPPHTRQIQRWCHTQTHTSQNKEMK